MTIFGPFWAKVVVAPTVFAPELQKSGEMLKIVSDFLCGVAIMTLFPHIQGIGEIRSSGEVIQKQL
jgi:hypothetical protein